MIDRIASSHEIVLSKRSFGSAFPGEENSRPIPPVDPAAASMRPRRRISVVFSPTIPRGVAAFFDIAADGVRGISARD
jgi:hypothetical protein